MLLLFQLGKLNDHLFGKELFIRIRCIVLVFRKRLPICVSFPFYFEGRDMEFDCIST